MQVGFPFKWRKSLQCQSIYLGSILHWSCFGFSWQMATLSWSKQQKDPLAFNRHHLSAWVCRVGDRLLTWAWRHFGCTIFKMHRKALLPPSGESVKMFDLCGRASFFSTSVIKCAPLFPRRPGGWPPGASVAHYCTKSPFYLGTEKYTINAETHWAMPKIFGLRNYKGQ